MDDDSDEDDDKGENRKHSFIKIRWWRKLEAIIY